MWEFSVCLCFVMHYFVSILVLQSSWRGRESWLLCYYCLTDVLLLLMLCGSSSRCRGLVCSVWLWYLLILLTYFLYMERIKHYLMRNPRVLIFGIWHHPSPVKQEKKLWNAAKCDTRFNICMYVIWRNSDHCYKHFCFYYRHYRHHCDQARGDVLAFLDCIFIWNICVNIFES